jgi:hypothetical protein
MTSILETPETRPSTPGSGPGRILAVAGIAVAIVILGLTAYLLVALRDARRQIAHLTERTTIADQRAKELDLALAALGGQTVTIAERAGVTAAELRRRRRWPGSCAKRSGRARPTSMRSAARSAG